MISTDGMRALRVSATLAHAVPAIRVRLLDCGRLAVEVAPHCDRQDDLVEAAGGEAHDHVLRLTPCQYRTAVGRAWSAHVQGQSLRMLHLLSDPVVEIDLPRGGHRLANGLHRVPMGGRHLYVTTTTLAVDRCHAALVGEDEWADDEVAAACHAWGVALHADGITGVTLVHAELEVGVRDEELALLEDFEAVIVRLAVTELLDEVGPPTPGSVGPGSSGGRPGRSG